MSVVPTVTDSAQQLEVILKQNGTFKRELANTRKENGSVRRELEQARSTFSPTQNSCRRPTCTASSW